MPPTWGMSVYCVLFFAFAVIDVVVMVAGGVDCDLHPNGGRAYMISESNSTLHARRVI